VVVVMGVDEEEHAAMRGETEEAGFGTIQKWGVDTIYLGFPSINRKVYHNHQNEITCMITRD
jgi:hypothetical protein